MRMATGAATLGLGLIVAASLPGAAQAQSWGQPDREFVRYGVGTIVCDGRTHDEPCLGLACLDGALVLVNAAGGGGPMDGDTRVSTGRTSFTMAFVWDDGAVDKLGVAASKADLTIDQFEALLAATSITLTAGSDSTIRHRFPTRGLAAAWRKVAADCR